MKTTLDINDSLLANAKVLVAQQRTQRAARSNRHECTLFGLSRLWHLFKKDATPSFGNVRFQFIRTVTFDPK